MGLSDGELYFAWSASALLLAYLLARRGLSKGSLSFSGALAAFIVGAVHMFCGLQYGLTLIIFYLTSSKLTRIGSKRKASLEAGHKEGGRRGAAQVMANSLGACTFAASSYVVALATPNSLSWLRASLAGAFLGHYACCCADTWASEVGILSRTMPRLITTGKKVPPGTNGGVSLLGICCSVAGGLAMGFAFFAGGALACAWGVIPTGGSLCPAASRGIHQPWTMTSGDPASLPMLAFVGLVCGLFGSLLDSLLGATLQYTGWDPQTGRVVTEAQQSVPDDAGRARMSAPRVEHVSGVPLLSNNGVNFIAATAMAAMGAVLLPQICGLRPTSGTSLT